MTYVHVFFLAALYFKVCCLKKQKIKHDKMTDNLVSIEKLTGQRAVQQRPSLLDVVLTGTGGVSLQESGR